MKNILKLSLVALCFSFTLGTKYVTTNLNRRVILDIPKDYRELSEEEVIIEYGMDRVPLGTFVDETGEVSIMVTEHIDSLRYTTIKYKHEEDMLKAKEDLNIEKSFLLSSYYNTYDDLNIIMDTVKEVNGVPFVFVEYTGSISGKNSEGEETKSELYNYVAYGYRRNRKYIINFSAPLYRKDKLTDITSHIFDSIRI